MNVGDRIQALSGRQVLIGRVVKVDGRSYTVTIEPDGLTSAARVSLDMYTWTFATIEPAPSGADAPVARGVWVDSRGQEWLVEDVDGERVALEASQVRRMEDLEFLGPFRLKRGLRA